jgi:hypothetical protein
MSREPDSHSIGVGRPKAHARQFEEEVRRLTGIRTYEPRPDLASVVQDSLNVCEDLFPDCDCRCETGVGPHLLTLRNVGLANSAVCQYGFRRRIELLRTTK